MAPPPLGKILDPPLHLFTVCMVLQKKTFSWPEKIVLCSKTHLRIMCYSVQNKNWRERNFEKKPTEILNWIKNQVCCGEIFSPKLPSSFMYAVRLLKVPFCYWEMRIFHANEQETFSPEEQLIAAALRCEHYFESLPRPKRQHITFGCFKDDILNLRSLFVTERNHYKKSIPFPWKCNYCKPYSHMSEETANPRSVHELLHPLTLMFCDCTEFTWDLADL